MSPLLAVSIALGWVGIILLMRTKRFYFIRHGETTLNAAHIKQGAEGGLSQEGKDQAAAIGKYLQPLHIGKIIASPYERARETAHIINSYLHAGVAYSPLLVERRNASEVIGKSTKDPEVKRIVDLTDNAYHPDDYRYADEENFNDMKLRARRCLRMLTRQSPTVICVVTHHAFLKMLLAYMLYHESLHAREFIKLSYFNVSDNGGISTVEYTPWKMFSKTRGWKVIAYNEQAPVPERFGR